MLFPTPVYIWWGRLGTLFVWFFVLSLSRNPSVWLSRNSCKRTYISLPVPQARWATLETTSNCHSRPLIFRVKISKNWLHRCLYRKISLVYAVETVYFANIWCTLTNKRRSQKFGTCFFSRLVLRISITMTLLNAKPNVIDAAWQSDFRMATQYAGSGPFDKKSRVPTWDHPPLKLLNKKRDFHWIFWSLGFGIAPCYRLNPRSFFAGHCFIRTNMFRWKTEQTLANVLLTFEYIQTRV